MIKPRPKISIWAWILLAGCLLTADAYGYIDPGTGSFVLQVAIAFLVGLAFSVKLFWKRISASIRRLFSRKNSGESDVR